MKKTLLSNAAALLLFLLPSCVASLEQVRVESYGVEDVVFAGASRITMTLSIKVHNPSTRKLTLQHAAFDVLDSDAPVARLRLLEPVEIPASSDVSCALPVELEITNMLALLTGGIDLRNPQLDDLLVNGSLQVKAGLLRKTVNIRKKTVGQLLKEL
ncbi:MAG: hypothetical protein LBN98_02805 [Prevotellaceae bacterium]|nr:hypothetical protein [Prevotellaceae bacterium]